MTEPKENENENENKVMTLPESITISGKLALAAKEYIAKSPCPNHPVAYAIELIGGFELAMRDAALAAEAKSKPNGRAKGTPEDILAEAKRRAAEQEGAGE